MNDIPLEIIEAANKIDLYFKKQGIDTWELMHTCSRNHAYRLREIEKIVDFKGKPSLTQSTSTDHPRHK